tara:strand:+ start:395 stop:1426 length:1032 start_codon:yes stop_codon:yes gene_type:complete
LNIRKIESHPYRLEFNKPFKTASTTYQYREGFVLKIYSDSFVGIGEVSPLEGFNNESLQECYYSLEAINQSISNIGDIDKKDLFDIFDLHTTSMPSLSFALETAIFDISGQESNVPISKYINNNCNDVIKLNGIHGPHSPSDGFKVIKVKLGFNNIYDDIEKMDQLSSMYGEEVKFRIDINGQLDLVKAIRFCKSMEKFNIDYIEQPIEPDNLEDLAELRLHTNIKIGVDESIVDIFSAGQLIDNQAADVFIIKPMTIGKYSTINNIIKLAQKNDIECVITNMLDSAINRMACIQVALSNNISKECGVSSDNLFISDLGQTPSIQNGEITLNNNPGLGITFND